MGRGASGSGRFRVGEKVWRGRYKSHTLHPALEDGTDRGFRNVGIQQSDAGKTPKRIHNKRQYVCASNPALPNNIRSDVLNHGTNTRTETQHGQNSYLQNTNKVVQGIYFQKLCTAYLTPDTDAQHTNPS